MLATLALGMGWVLFLSRLIFSGDVPYERDLLWTNIPLKHYLRERLLAGEWPQWYPYELLGVPLSGSILTGYFHPQTLLSFLSAAVAVKWTLLLSYLVALAGAYRLARSLSARRSGAVAAAFAFTFGGYPLGVANNLQYVVPLATAPWALHFAVRLLRRQRWRDASCLGLSWALIFLGGDPQLLLGVGAFSVGGLWLAGPSRRKLGLFAVAGVLAVLVSSAELLPALTVSRESFRSEWKVSPVLGERWALHPLRLPELFIPGYTPSAWRNDAGRLLYTEKENVWSSSVFAGGLALVLAALAFRRNRRTALACTIAAIGSLWMATGTYGRLLPLLWRLVPTLDKYRYPEKYAALVWLALIPLVALGLEAVRSAPRRAALWFGTAALTTWVAWLVSLVVDLPGRALTLRGHPLAPDDPFRLDLATAWTNGLRTTACFLLIATVTLWLGTSRRRTYVLLPGLVFLELFVAHFRLIPLAPRAAVEAPSALARQIAAFTPPGAPSPRVLPLQENSAALPGASPDELVERTHDALRPDDTGRADLASFDHNLPSEPARSLRTFFGQPALSMSSWSGRFNVCFRGTRPAPDAAVSLVGQPCLPRAFLTGARHVGNADEALKTMQAGLPLNEAVWENGPELPPTTGTVRWLQYSPEHLRLEVTTAKPAALVLTDAYAPGWQASIDQRPTPIYATDVAARGIAVGAGTHLVEFSYHAPWLRLGCVLSVLGLALGAMLLRRKPSLGAPQPDGS